MWPISVMLYVANSPLGSSSFSSLLHMATMISFDSFLICCHSNPGTHLSFIHLLWPSLRTTIGSRQCSSCSRTLTLYDQMLTCSLLRWRLFQGSNERLMT